MNDKTPITKINKEALKRLPVLIQSLTKKEEQTSVKVNISFDNYYSQMITLHSIIKAIKVISYEDMNEQNQNNAHLVNELSSIASQIIPFNECEFLDELLIKTDFGNPNFVEINQI